MDLNYYLYLLGYANMPDFLIKYLDTPSLIRLKKIGYFCGMDYASKDIYNFSTYISRYTHSLTTALLTYKISSDRKATLAGLFHDVGTPCFSHVIDYMNKDYANQESTEEYTERIILSDNYLRQCLLKDGVSVNEIIYFKKYSLVDSARPKLCADRLDGIILNSLGWTKTISKQDIKDILNSIAIYINEEGKEEIGFTNYEVANKVVELSDTIDRYCHSNEDNYMMELLARITKYALDNGYTTYDGLYRYDEEYVFGLLYSIRDRVLEEYLLEFTTKKKEDIPTTKLPNLKARVLKPLVNSKRM